MKLPSSNKLSLLAFFLAILCSFLPLPFLTPSAKCLTTLFMQLLKLVSLPLIFLAVIATLTRMENIKEAKYLLKKSLKFTLLTTLLAASLALLLFLILRPSYEGIVNTVAPTMGKGYFDILSSIIPSNIVSPFLKNNVMGVVFLAAVFGLGILHLPIEHKKPLASVFSALFETLLLLAKTLLKVLPLMIFAFTLLFINTLKTHQESLKPLLLYALAIISANLIQGIIVIPTLLKIKKIPPFKLFKAMLPALSTAFFSKSSSATLPLTIKCAQGRAHLSKKVSSFTLPLCSVINMNGCAAFILITTLFVASHSGVVFSIPQMILWIVIATLAAIGNAGVPMGCFFLTSALLIGLNIPLHLMGTILPLYTLFDMLETALNVWSDASVTAMVDKEVASHPKT